MPKPYGLNSSLKSTEIFYTMYHFKEVHPYKVEKKPNRIRVKSVFKLLDTMGMMQNFHVFL